MTKKHYIETARILREQVDAARVKIGASHAGDPDDGLVGRGALEAVIVVANELASLFANDNPRFDRDRFLAACGVVDVQPNDCEGHPDGPVMGETFYCDGTCVVR